MGYHYVREMKTFLFQGQEDALMLTARAVATVLNDRTALFNPDTGIPELLGESGGLLAHQLDQYLKLDGRSDDWGDVLGEMQMFASTTRPDAFSCRSCPGVPRPVSVRAYHGKRPASYPSRPELSTAGQQ